MPFSSPPRPRRRLERAIACAALGAAAALLAPRELWAFEVFGDVLDLSQRDFRVFNNFTGAFANDNVVPDPDFPGSIGATLAIRKAVAEWGSEPHGSGTTDPLQAQLGSGGANFDSFWAGEATGPGGTNGNVISALPGSSFILAFTELPISDGWRILVYDAVKDWHDGPGMPSGGSAPWDLQGVVTHEYGHALGLDHSLVPGATMYAGAGGSLGVPQRTIEQDDQAGVQFLYGVRSSAKPRITGYTLLGAGVVRLTGTGFDLSANDVWFTPDTPSDGSPVLVSGVPSPTGLALDVSLPAGVGPGDVLVRLPGTSADRLSNAFPFDPARGPWSPPRAYGPAGTSSGGTPVRLTALGLPSATAGSFILQVSGGPTVGRALVFSGPRAERMPGRFGALLVGGPWRREGDIDLLFGNGETSLPVRASEVGTQRYYQVLVLDSALSAGGVFSDAYEIELVP
ncbi:MAG: matrixin family metalloprotease [Planctomycetota bacterium]